MAYRRFARSNRRFGSSRFRGRPLARAQYLWTFATGSLTGTAAEAAEFLSPTQWQSNTTAGNFERAKLLCVLFTLQVTPPASGPTGIHYALHIDDESFQTTLDPSTATFFDSASRVLRWGVVVAPSNLASDAPDSGYGNVDFIRQWKGRANLARDQRVWFSLQAKPTDFDVTWIARCLVQI